MLDKITQLILEDHSVLNASSFGADRQADGEVVFNTGMVGYPETLTDPSYRGQILVLTYPLIGNYGIPHAPKLTPKNIFDYPFESEKIQVTGLVVSEYCSKYSHPHAKQSLKDWLQSEGIPAIEGVDTRALTQKLREEGTMLGRIESRSKNQEVRNGNFEDPNSRNLVAEVSCKEPIIYEPQQQTINYKLQTILLYDCGVKLNIIRCLLKRGCRVIRVPWDYPFKTAYKVQETNYPIDGVVISNGPGDPTKCDKIIEQIYKLQTTNYKLPILGICLGNQILALATGAKTYKLPYGHRGQNQPVKMSNIKYQRSNVKQAAFITTQNHSYAVDTDTLPSDFEPWFTNLNDGTNEGLRHKEKPWMSVQFHPEACPGPTDTEWIFDDWLSLIKNKKRLQDL